MAYLPVDKETVIEGPVSNTIYAYKSNRIGDEGPIILTEILSFPNLDLAIAYIQHTYPNHNPFQIRSQIESAIVDFKMVYNYYWTNYAAEVQYVISINNMADDVELTADGLPFQGKPSTQAALTDMIDVVK